MDGPGRAQGRRSPARLSLEESSRPRHEARSWRRGARPMVLSRPAKQGLEDALTVRSTNELHKASGECARDCRVCCECERGHLKPRLGPAQGAVLDMHQLALKVASASRARLVGHVRPPRLPFPTSDGPPGGRWRSGFASTRLHAPAKPHTESPRSMRLKGALLERTRVAPPSSN